MKVSELEVFLFGILVLAVFFGLFTYAILNYRRQKKGGCVSPYTGKPMWEGSLSL